MLPSLCRSELQWLNDLSEIANIPSRFKSKIATVNVFLFRSGSEQAKFTFRIRARHTISFGSEPNTLFLSDQDPSKLNVFSN